MPKPGTWLVTQGFGIDWVSRLTRLDEKADTGRTDAFGGKVSALMKTPNTTPSVVPLRPLSAAGSLSPRSRRPPAPCLCVGCRRPGIWRWGESSPAKLMLVSLGKLIIHITWLGTRLSATQLICRRNRQERVVMLATMTNAAS